jgi:glycosyltransferase involved in cell wall biosynthesis
MKVAHVTGALIAGGAERFAVNLTAWLSRLGHDVELWVMSNRRESVAEDYEVQLREAGVRIVVGPTTSVGLETVMWCRGLLKSSGLDAVHLHTPNTELLFALSKYGLNLSTRTYRTIHNSVVPRKWAQKFVFSHAKYAVSVACGAAVENEFRNAFSHPLIGIQNGVDFSWPIQSYENKLEARARLGIESEGMHFLCMGRMDGAAIGQAQKGHDTLINAWKLSRMHERFDATLHFLGDGNLRGELERVAGHEVGIVFHGVRPSAWQWLLASDVYVMPSRWEGLPIAGIEAAGTGVPCVFSRIPTLLELSPTGALWFDIDDAAELGTVLEGCAAGRKATSLEDTLQFRERFGMEGCARAYSAMYCK